MLPKLIANKMKQRIPGNNIPLNDFRRQLVYTRISLKDTNSIIKELQSNNLISIRKKHVYMK